MRRRILFVFLIIYTNLVLANEAEDVPYNKNQISIASISEYGTRIFVNTNPLALQNATVKNLQNILKGVQSKEETVFNINESADGIVSSVSNYILRNWDPTGVTTHNIRFEYRPILITHTGNVALTGGQLQELSAFRRTGDATLTHFYPPERLRVSIPLFYNVIIVRYNFRMEVRGDVAEGILHAWFFDTAINYNVDVSMDIWSTVGRAFELNIGSLEINLFGTGLSNSYRRLISDLTNDVLKQTVIQYSDDIVGGLLDAGVISAVRID